MIFITIINNDNIFLSLIGSSLQTPICFTNIILQSCSFIYHISIKFVPPFLSKNLKINHTYRGAYQIGQDFDQTHNSEKGFLF